MSSQTLDSSVEITLTPHCETRGMERPRIAAEGLLRRMAYVKPRGPNAVIRADERGSKYEPASRTNPATTNPRGEIYLGVGRTL
jgi:hypothetical protein